MTTTRNHNNEFQDSSRKYMYDFDQVMHDYMIQSFKPFFTSKNVLEMGSFQGEFTKKLLPHFNDITCIEASNEAIKIAQEKLNRSKGQQNRYTPQPGYEKSAEASSSSSESKLPPPRKITDYFQ